MNRNLIRLCGAVISILMGVGTRIADAAESCAAVPVEYQSGRVIYQKGTCTNRLSGYIMSDYRHEHMWKSCATGDYSVPFAECSGGFCTPTGLFCFTPDYFIKNGCSTSSTTCRYTAGTAEITVEQEFFYSCTNSAYQTTSSVPSHTNPSNGSNFSSYCQPCSGLKFENNSFVTISTTGANNDQFYWVSQNGKIGIESCRAYPKVQTYTDNRGTFSVLPDGCSYKS